MIRITRLMFLCFFLTMSSGLQAQNTHESQALQKNEQLVRMRVQEPKPVCESEEPDFDASSGLTGLAVSSSNCFMTAKAGEMQQRYTQKLDSVVSSASKQYYEYDADGNISLDELYYTNGGELIGSHKYVRSYDEYGNCTSYLTFRWNNGSWENRYRRVYEYDLNGNITYYKYSKWNGLSWQDSYYYCQEWDDAGHLIKYEYYNWSDSIWVGNNKWESSYDANNNETMYARYSWSDGTWVGDYKYLYGYDENDVENSYCFYRWDSDLSQWYKSCEESWTTSNDSCTYTYIDYIYENNVSISQQKNIYTYNGNGKLIYDAYYAWIDSVWNETEYRVWTYDGNICLSYAVYENIYGTMRQAIETEVAISGNVYTFTYYNVNYMLSDSSLTVEKSIKSRRAYTYDDRGYCIENIFSYYIDGEFVVYDEYYYAYDDNGNLTLRECYGYNSNSSALEGRYKYEYEYNDRNEMVMQAYYYWSDGMWTGSYKYDYYHRYNSNYIAATYYWNGYEWYSDTKRIYEYDDNGNCIYSEYFSWTDNSWQPVYKYLYSYDTEGRRTKMEYYEYDSSNSCYVQSNRNEYSYYKGSKQSIVKNYVWSADDSMWYINQTEYTYNEYDDISAVVSYDYNEQVTGTIAYTYDTSVPASSIAGGLAYYSRKLLSVKEESLDWNDETTYCYSSMTFGEVTLTVNPGWNWISTPVESGSAGDAKKFAESFGDIQYVASQTASLYKDDELGWFGNLDRISATQGYKVNSLNAEASSVIVSGYINENPVHLNAGWTWIGYNNSESQSVATALPSAEEGDVIKSKDAFATYTEGAWVGNLTMTPGQGYKYQTSAAKVISYNRVKKSSANVAGVQSFNTDNSGFASDNGKYSDNTAVIAKIAGDAEQGRYVVGAFAGKECRGKSSVSNEMHFVTVQGENNGETIQFRIYDTMTGETFMANEAVSFNGGIIGTVSNPVSLTFGAVTGVESIKSESDTQLYDIHGRALEDNAAHGLVITNGKKIMMK